MQVFKCDVTLYNGEIVKPDDKRAENGKPLRGCTAWSLQMHIMLKYDFDKMHKSSILFII